MNREKLVEIAVEAASKFGESADDGLADRSCLQYSGGTEADR